MRHGRFYYPGFKALAALFLTVSIASFAGCSKTAGPQQLATGSLPSEGPAATAAPAATTPAPHQASQGAPSYRWNGNPNRVSSGQDPAGTGMSEPNRAGKPKLVWNASPQAPVSAPKAAPVSGKGQAIVVEPGDTLYGLSKRHGVSVAELIDQNRLSGVAIKPGQQLILPKGAH